MVLVKILSGRRGTVVVEDSTAYIFDMGGNFVEERSTEGTNYKVGALTLPVLSVLSCNSQAELGVDSSLGFKTYGTNKKPMDLAMAVQMRGGFLRMLRRDGMSCGERYNQLLFVYKEGTDLEEIVNSVLG